tara:strand:+ start:1292 stop:2113 length:822 start_codon:yes stop_codon:yes gene_type:complete
MKDLDISIIFEDNPISRCYLNILKQKKILVKNLLILKKKSILPNQISLRYNFQKNNYWPLKFLKDKNFLDFINDSEKFFNYEKNFINEMYNYSNLVDKNNNLIFSENENINSKENIDLINSLDCKYVLNTGNKILKNVLDSNKKFIHIHPGFLPIVKGADSSLWHINKFRNLGVSSFIMSKKIDDGEIINRRKIIFSKIKFKNYENFNYKALYRAWFSFFDPLLRGSLFIDLIENDVFNNPIEFINDKSSEENYYSFMHENDLKKTFKLIFEN